MQEFGMFASTVMLFWEEGTAEQHSVALIGVHYRKFGKGKKKWSLKICHDFPRKAYLKT